MNLRLALRNVFRNRRRTAFSLAVIALGVAILCFVLGFVSESIVATKESVACETGAVQIADPAVFQDAGTATEHLMSKDVLDRLVALVKDFPGVSGVTWQLNFTGLVGAGQETTLLLGRGLIPCNCLQDYACQIVDGDALPADASRDILLGHRLAERLHVKKGDTVNVATATVAGNFNAATLRVIGLVAFANATQEEQLGIVPLAFAQRLLRTEGVERVQVVLTDLDTAPAFARVLQAKLDAAGLRLEVHPWQDLSTFYSSIRTFWGAFAGFAELAVSILVFFSVLEVLTMAFLERTREIGTVRAIGMTRRRVFGMFLLEGVLVGVIGALIGVAVGTGVGLLFNGLHIPWTPPGAAIPQALRVGVGLAQAGPPFLAALVATLLSALYPAWRNARLKIVTALRSA
jgi:putative ABC transport system permease protein